MRKRAREFVPNSPGEVTLDWAASALSQTTGCPIDAVRSVAVEPLSTGGQGMTGQTVRLRIDADDPRVPASVVAKFAATDPQTRALVESYDSYAREIRFYQRFASRVPVATPRYFGASYDPGTSGQPGPIASRFIDALPAAVKLWMSRNVTKYLRPSNRRYALLIEDMGSAGAIYDLVNPPNRDQIALALDALATVHATFWDDSSLAGDDVFEVLVTSTPNLFSTVATRRSLPIAMDRYDWCGPTEAALLADAVNGLAQDVKTLNRPMTLVHGDPRSDNLIYTPEGTVILLDWAVVGHGHPGWDVGYLLSSCVQSDQIEQADSLVEHYLASMESHGVGLDRATLQEGIMASYRAVTVQQLLALAVFDGRLDDAEDAELADFWLPRLVAGLGHRWSA